MSIRKKKSRPSHPKVNGSSDYKCAVQKMSTDSWAHARVKSFLKAKFSWADLSRYQIAGRDSTGATQDTVPG